MRAMGQFGDFVRARGCHGLKSVQAAEQERPDVAEARLRWANDLQSRILPSSCFVDEDRGVNQDGAALGGPSGAAASSATFPGDLKSDFCGRVATGWVHRALRHRLRHKRRDLHPISAVMLIVAAARRYRSHRQPARP